MLEIHTNLNLSLKWKIHKHTYIQNTYKRKKRKELKIFINCYVCKHANKIKAYH